MPLPRPGRGRGRESSAVPPPTLGRDRDRGSTAVPPPTLGRDRGSPAVPPPTRGRVRDRGTRAVPPPTRGRDRGSLAVPPPTRRRDRADSLFDDILLPGRSSAVYFDVPVAGGREVMSVDCQEQRTLCEEQHVGSSASAQMPHPDGLQHLDFSCLPCKEMHVAEPAPVQTLHKLDVLSLKDPRFTTTMEGSSTTTSSLPSPHYTIEASLTSERRLSSSPIWKRRDFEWAITFHTIKDLRGYFHTFPHVGGPFQSKDEANKAIDRYLIDHRDLTMGMGLSEVDKLIQKCRYFPDGTKKRMKKGEPIDKRRDMTYQLVQALLYKYNDLHNLIGDIAYEVKDVLGESYWEEENYRIYIHLNFTAKTKGSDGFDTGCDNLFFAEVTCVGGDDGFVVNCCCMVKPFDNGLCVGCGSTMKHPNDGAYTGGHMNALCSRPFGSDRVKATWVYEEDSDEEVERLRLMFGGGRATARVLLEA